MKNISFLFFFTCLSIFSIQGFGQKEPGAQMLDFILEEKVRFDKPIPLDKLRPPVSASWGQNIALRESEEIKMTHNSSFGLSEGEPMIAVDPNNPNRIALGYMAFGNGSLDMPVYHSEDGGENWRKSTFSTLNVVKRDKETRGELLQGGGDPVLVYDLDGTLWYSFISLTLGSKGRKFICWLAYSENNGVSFKQDSKTKYLGRALIVGNQIAKNYGNGLLDRQWMLIDHSDGPNRGRHYLSGLYIAKGPVPIPQITVTSRGPNESSFPTNFNAISSVTTPQFAHMALDKNGGLHVVYVTIASGEMYYQFSDDAGKTFTAPVIVDYLTYNKQSAIKTVQPRENPMPNIAVSKDGSVLYASWTDFNNNESHSYINRSTDGGKTWERAYALDDLTDFGAMSLMPSIAVNSEDDLVVSWYAVDEELNSHFMISVKRHDQDKFETKPIFISTKSTPFQQYVRNQRVFFGDYYNITTVGTKTYAVFADGRKSKGAKLYLAITDHKSLETKIIPVEESTLSIDQVFPQPATSSLKLQMNQQLSAPFKCKWVNMAGAVIHQEEVDVTDGLVRLDVPENCEAGAYVIELVTSGYPVVRKKVTVVR